MALFNFGSRNSNKKILKRLQREFVTAMGQKNRVRQLFGEMSMARDDSTKGRLELQLQEARDVYSRSERDRVKRILFGSSHVVEDDSAVLGAVRDFKRSDVFRKPAVRKSGGFFKKGSKLITSDQRRYFESVVNKFDLQRKLQNKDEVMKCGTPYLVATHGIDGIEGLARGPYQKRSGIGSSSATVTWAGAMSTPTTLFGDGFLGFVLGPSRINIGNAEFRAKATFGKVIDSADMSLKSDFEPTKYQEKRGMIRGERYVTDYSRWDSIEKS